MPSEVLVSSLIINELTTAQYDEAKQAGEVKDSEVYIVTDKVEVHNESVDAHPHILNELNKKATPEDIADAIEGLDSLKAVAAGPGLKVSEKVEGSQTIDIDETFVFVIDGGTSTTVL